jgi:hypothetical protein
MQGRSTGLPMENFISDFYDSAAALVIPLSRYSVFLKMLLKQGGAVKLKLLVYLIVRKRQSLTHLVKSYAKSIPYMREQSR